MQFYVSIHSDSFALPLPIFRSIDGSKIRLLKSATKSVNETSNPSETVPPNFEAIKIPKPKNSTTEVYIMLTPVSLIAHITDAFELLFVRISSCLYLARKCMELSTDIPKAMLNTITVLGFNDIPQ